jgi:hypothetical protein
MSMNCIENDHPLIKKIKRNVHLLQDFLRLEVPDIKLGECYNIYARFAGYRNWSTLSAVLKKMSSNNVRATDIAQVAILAFDKDQDKAFQWLNTPHIALNGKRPIEIWGNAEGAQQVIGVLSELNWELNSSSAQLLSLGRYADRSGEV